MQQRALDTSRKLKVRCVHGDVVDYPLVPVSIQFWGKTHRVKVAVNSHLRHLLILGTDVGVCGCFLGDRARKWRSSGAGWRCSCGTFKGRLRGNESEGGLHVT